MTKRIKIPEVRRATYFLPVERWFAMSVGVKSGGRIGRQARVLTIRISEFRTVQFHPRVYIRQMKRA